MKLRERFHRGVPMRSSLDESGRELVLRFFHLLLRIQDASETEKHVDVARALTEWNLQEFGKTRQQISPHNGALVRWSREDFDPRREWLAAHPDLTYREAAMEWGIQAGAAYQWMRGERKRRGIGA